MSNIEIRIIVVRINGRQSRSRVQRLYPLDQNKLEASRACSRRAIDCILASRGRRFAHEAIPIISFLALSEQVWSLHQIETHRRHQVVSILGNKTIRTRDRQKK